ncbi:HNH endonuclease [bacterium]|nr:HNH endonuclease [bacterium]
MPGVAPRQRRRRHGLAAEPPRHRRARGAHAEDRRRDQRPAARLHEDPHAAQGPPAVCEVRPRGQRPGPGRHRRHRRSGSAHALQKQHQQKHAPGAVTISTEAIDQVRLKAVQLLVWKCDGGRCVECGSKENLEYDHIIPVSKGGANTARNIQLLCQSCNRKKSNKIGG